MSALEVLSLCGCPTKLLLQQGSFVCAVTVAFDTRCKHLSLCVYSNAFVMTQYVTACLYCSLLQGVPETLIVAAVRGVSKNKNITEFQLEPDVCEQQVVDGILAQLRADERKKFKVGRDCFGHPSIELCPVGEWCIVSLLMQCLCCVSEVLIELYKRSSLSFPSWLCWLGGTSSLLCVILYHL